MRLYWVAYKFNCLQDFAYPIEIFAFIARRLINLGFLILFWLVISKTNQDIFSFKQIISYFLIASSVQDLTFTSSGGWDRDIRKMIREGLIQNLLIRPVNILRFWYFSYMGRRTRVTIFAIITLVVGIYIYPPPTLSGILLFPITLVLTTLTGAGLDLLVGTAAFYSPDAGNISNVVDHIKNILSGHLIPLNYFPGIIKTISFYSPFPVLVYFPASILQQSNFNQETVLKLLLSLFWALAILYIGNLSWKKALKNYDGAGI